MMDRMVRGGGQNVELGIGCPWKFMLMEGFGEVL